MSGTRGVNECLGNWENSPDQAKKSRRSASDRLSDTPTYFFGDIFSYNLENTCDISEQPQSFRNFTYTSSYHSENGNSKSSPGFNVNVFTNEGTPENSRSSYVEAMERIDSSLFDNDPGTGFTHRGSLISTPSPNWNSNDNLMSAFSPPQTAGDLTYTHRAGLPSPQPTPRAAMESSHFLSPSTKPTYISSNNSTPRTSPVSRIAGDFDSMRLTGPLTPLYQLDRPQEGIDASYPRKISQGNLITSQRRLARHKCPKQECSSAFGRRSELERHFRNAHQGRFAYNCEVFGCDNNRGRGYSRIDKLREHHFKAHKSDGPEMTRQGGEDGFWRSEVSRCSKGNSIH